MNKDHEDKTLLACEYCRKGLKTSQFFKNHIGLKDTKINYDCSNCEEVVQPITALSIQAPKRKVYNCNTCPFEATQ